MTTSLFSLINATGIAALIALELRSPRFRQLFFDRTRLPRNLGYLATGLGAALLLHTITAALAQTLPRLHWGAPLWLQLIGVFLLAELFNWVLHWAKHRYEVLWRFHCQHHRDDVFSPWLVTNTYAPEVVLSGSLMAAGLLMAGFDPISLDTYLLFYSLVNVYQHSSLPHSLGWLDRLIINPAYHRHHHSGERVNFGSALSVWDWVFRTATWPKDRFVAVEPPPIAASPEPFGFVDEMLYPWRPRRWVRSAPQTPTPSAR